MAEPVPQNRPLTAHEHRLVQWMLEHGESEAASFLPQLELASVTPWRCSCGCASIDFAITGHPTPTGNLQPLADFVLGNDDELSGIFVFEQSGVLSGVEVYGFMSHVPRTLPEPEVLRPSHALAPPREIA